MIIRELLIALMALFIFLFFGQHVLRLLNISDPSLTIACGIVLFMISIKMVFPPAGGHAAEQVEGEPFIVPLATPYVAGPSTLSTVLFISNREPERWMDWSFAILIAWMACALIIGLAGKVRKFSAPKASSPPNASWACYSSPSSCKCS